MAKAESIPYLRSEDIFGVAWDRVYQFLTVAVSCFTCGCHLLDCRRLIIEDFRQRNFKDPLSNLFN